MLWIDYFRFDGEEIAFTRLEHLFPVVDKFYISEQRYISKGVKKKALYIDTMRKRFEPYLSKIEFLVHQEQKEQEQQQADENVCAGKILAENSDAQFIVTVCEVDEIPDVSVMKCVKEGLYNKCAEGCIYMEMPVYYYNLNWRSEAQTSATAFVMNDILLKEHKEFQKFREQRGPVFGIFECGWHFSYFMSIKEILRKMSWMKLDAEFLSNCIMYGKDLCKRDYVRIVQNSVVASKFPKEFMALHGKTMGSQFEM
jgi:hypothetical protein